MVRHYAEFMCHSFGSEGHQGVVSVNQCQKFLQISAIPDRADASWLQDGPSTELAQLIGDSGSASVKT